VGRHRYRSADGCERPLDEPYTPGEDGQSAQDEAADGEERQTPTGVVGDEPRIDDNRAVRVGGIVGDGRPIPDDQAASGEPLRVRRVVYVVPGDLDTGELPSVYLSHQSEGVFGRSGKGRGTLFFGDAAVGGDAVPQVPAQQHDRDKQQTDGNRMVRTKPHRLTFPLSHTVAHTGKTAESGILCGTVKCSRIQVTGTRRPHSTPARANEGISVPTGPRATRRLVPPLEDRPCGIIHGNR
jgi:hypothetical protein